MDSLIVFDVSRLISNNKFNRREVRIMRKLRKKNTKSANSIEAYWGRICICNCACGGNTSANIAATNGRKLAMRG